MSSPKNSARPPRATAAARSFRTLAGRVAAAALAAAAATGPAAAEEIRIRLDGGRVTLIANEAPLADVLDAWARAGDVRFVDADKLDPAPVTLHLIDVGEADALGLLLRAAPGYVAAPRAQAAPGAARYDRVRVLAARRRPTPEPEPADDAPNPFAGDPAGRAAAMPIEDLQGLIEAVAGSPAAATLAPAETSPGATRAPTVAAAPFPGMVVEPGPR